jgi:phosphate transport system protein
MKPTQRMHIDRAFEQDLARLREELSKMAEAVERQIAAGMTALSERDARLARRVIEGDAEVNRRELEVDELCRRILALRQPAASDLRLITTAIKIVTDLERIGDLAAHIAARAVELAQPPPIAGGTGLPRLAAAAQAQVHRALRAFVDQDAAAAAEVIQGDQTVDSLFQQTFNELLVLMMEDSRTIRRATALLFVARHLERIADHATNIAEMTVYLVLGTDVRHPKSRVAAIH